MLNRIFHGEPTERAPLVIAHGLYGSGRNWGVIAKRLSDERQVIAVDMRNHGHSPWFDSNTYADMAADLAQVVGRGPMDVLGHSMGGKAAMVLALSQPELVRHLLVADIAPVAYAHTQLPHIAAMQSADFTGVTRRSEADARLAATVDDPALRSFFLQSLDLTADPPRWRLNLKALGENMPSIMGFPAVEGQFDRPTLFLSGGDSTYVLPDHRPGIKALFPNAKFAKIPGAGHWLHAEKPREFIAAAATFFDA